jgi:predicted component of type VI protein secretion system
MPCPKRLEKGSDRRDFQYQDGYDQLQQDAASYQSVVDGLAVIGKKVGNAQNQNKADKACKSLHSFDADSGW